jgi:hypothetical protein
MAVSAEDVSVFSEQRHAGGWPKCRLVARWLSQWQKWVLEWTDFDGMGFSPWFRHG